MTGAVAPHIDFPPRAEPYGDADLALLPEGGAHVEGGTLVVHTRLNVDQALAAYPDHGHIELIEGRLHVNAAPGVPHADVAYLTALWLNDHGPAGYKAREAVNVRLDDATMPIPDVALLPTAIDGVWVEAGDVVLAVEVISPNDLPHTVNAKAARYLAAGLRAVWVIHPSERRIETYGDSTGLDAEELAARLWPR